MYRILLSLVCCVMPTAVFAAEAVKISLEGPNQDLKNVFVAVPVSLPVKSNLLVSDGKKIYPAQIRNGSLLLGTDKSVLEVAISSWKAGQKLELTAVQPSGISGASPSQASFHWTTKDNYPLLTLGEKPVLEYMNAKHDDSTPVTHFLTFKVFHHVFDPVEGKTLLTAGAYRQEDKKLYPHHRGLFYGFNKISYDGKQADIWHGTDKVFVSDEGVLSKDEGPLVGGHRVAIDWHGKDGKTFAKEQREITAYNVNGGTMIDFVSLLKTDLPKVRLDGDPQHAGFHMRASQEVAENQKDVVGADGKKTKLNADTYYLREDGRGAGAETRNWDPKTKKGPVNLNWNAMSFVIGGKRYTALYMDHPKNPKEARYSERDYGRFGSYFEYDLTPDKPLLVRYRIWIQPGEMTVEQCKDFSAAFLYDGKASVQ